MTPSCTSGVAAFCPGGNASDHASCNRATLSLLILVSGEKPRPSCVRRHASQSFGDGFASNASVTGVAAASGSRGAGQGGRSTPGVSGPPGLNWRKRCCSASPSRPSGAGAWAVASVTTAKPASTNAAHRLIIVPPRRADRAGISYIRCEPDGGVSRQRRGSETRARRASLRPRLDTLVRAETPSPAASTL